jgi:DNA-binding NarL/FixJ family response regulator
MRVVARSADLGAIVSFLNSVDAQPSALLLEGEAGVGKTTLWLAAVEQARHCGFRTLSARTSEAESVLAYGTVADLLSEVDGDVLAWLPDVQRVAIDRVLLRDTSGFPPTDQHVVAAAMMSIIRHLSRQAPVVIGIDDLQWLDQCSRAVVAYVARRLTGRAALLLTERAEAGHPSALSWLDVGAPDGVSRIRVGPMSLGGLHELISTRLGRSFPRPTMRRIAEVSGGNPFYALELAHAIDTETSDAELGLPRTLADLVRNRVEDLCPDTRRVLLAAACVANPTVEALAQATSASVERTIELLGVAEDKGVITIDGTRVRYRHPLLARGVYTNTTPARRREMHSALAGVVTQPELRARHLGLAASRPDPEILRALDDAANAARARGAPAAAAELLDLAIKLGGDTPLRRTLSADHHLRAGDTMKAVAVLTPAIEQLPSNPTRAMALNLLAGIRVFHNNFGDAADLLKRAIDDAEGNPVMLLQTLLALAFAQSSAGDHDVALHTAQRAVAHAEELGLPALISQALAMYVTINTLDGNGVDDLALARALELEEKDLDVSIVFHASAANAQVLSWTGRLDEARTQLQDLRRRCVERGADSELMFVSVHTALVEVWRGRFVDAAHAAEEAVQLAEQIGGDHMVMIARTVRAAVAAYLGRESDARADVAAAIEAAERCGSPRLAYWPLDVLGFLEVSLGNYAEAMTALQQACDMFCGMPGTEIITATYIPDAVEALVALGRLDESQPMIKALEHNGRLLDRPWMLAIGGRCRAIMLAAQGDIEGAERAVREALTQHNRLPMPFERARTQLVLGQLLRRQRQKQTAAATIGEALAVFERLGSPLWAERARAELERIHMSPRHGHDLTPSQRRVAELAASGMTNAEVAAGLFISAKTVESNLTQVYRKLGIHSRAELGRLMGNTELTEP